MHVELEVKQAISDSLHEAPCTRCNGLVQLHSVNKTKTGELIGAIYCPYCDKQSLAHFHVVKNETV